MAVFGWFGQGIVIINISINIIIMYNVTYNYNWFSYLNLFKRIYSIIKWNWTCTCNASSFHLVLFRSPFVYGWTCVRFVSFGTSVSWFIYLFRIRIWNCDCVFWQLIQSHKHVTKVCTMIDDQSERVVLFWNVPSAKLNICMHLLYVRLNRRRNWIEISNSILFLSACFTNNLFDIFVK